ncbi:MAG: exopolyphosphatase [Flavobacteriales bacterium]|nr:exopolyphosphatase [Flavobacteriales bacterium]
MKYAAIDIGSNAVRLLILESKIISNDDFYFKKIGLTRVPIRLGDDVFVEKTISLKNLSKLTKALNAFKLIMEINEVDFFRACATSAMREAENSLEIKKHIQLKTGVNLEIISGKEEADIIFSNFHLTKLNPKHNYIYIDVGGGSTELSIIKNNKRIASKSFKIGSVRLLKNKVSNKIWPSINKWVEKQNVLNEKFTAIGTGGSINKIYNISNNSIGKPLSIIALKKVLTLISSYDYEDRIKILGLKPDRADVIVPSGDIYTEVMNSFKAEQIIVPKVGLANGIIYNLFLDNEIN